MRNHWNTCSIVAGILLAIMAPVPALAQATAVRDSGCARAEGALRRGARGSAYQRAVTALPGCATAGPLLVEQWSVPPGDSVELRALAAMSAIVLDQRVFDAARAAVLDAAGLRASRLAAMSVLVGHYHPCLAVAFEIHPMPTADGRLITVMVGENEHDASRPGVQPLNSSIRAEALAALDAAAGSGSDQVIRQASRSLANRLRGLPVSQLRCG